LKLRINIDKKTYEVDVEVAEPEAPIAQPLRTRAVEFAAVRAPANAAPAPAGGTDPVVEEKVCRSPVSGVVVRATVQVKQTLQVGDILMVLEAMKMETSVTAPVAGTVAAIKVKSGDSVQSGQVLVEFE
jgi:methylmalonyl-CoA carboxyltransferase 1.3S subunit